MRVCLAQLILMIFTICRMFLKGRHLEKFVQVIANHFQLLVSKQEWSSHQRRLLKTWQTQSWSLRSIRSVIFISNSRARGGSCRPRRSPHHGHLLALVVWWWPAPEVFLEQNEAAHLPSIWRTKALGDWSAPVTSTPKPLLRWAVSLLRNRAGYTLG